MTTGIYWDILEKLKEGLPTIMDKLSRHFLVKQRTVGNI